MTVIVKYKIMIVDEDPNICEIVQAYFDQEGYISLCSHSRKEAMELQASFQPHLIVVNMLLADESGMESCKHPLSFPDVPIVFLSNWEEDKSKIRAITDSGCDYVAKPFIISRGTAQKNSGAGNLVPYTAIGSFISFC